MHKTTAPIPSVPPARPLYAALSVAVTLALFVGLSQSESRSIYQGYDKWLHASVFFLLWWPACLRLGQSSEAATHAVDWRFDIRLWHWRWYLVLLAGTSRRGLTRHQRVVTGRVLGAALASFATLTATVGTAVLLLIKVSLGR